VFSKEYRPQEAVGTFNRVELKPDYGNGPAIIQSAAMDDDEETIVLSKKRLPQN